MWAMVVVPFALIIAGRSCDRSSFVVQASTETVCTELHYYPLRSTLAFARATSSCCWITAEASHSLSLYGDEAVA